jgi:glycosyltransferase involved in cell wall biosynthesis
VAEHTLSSARMTHAIDVFIDLSASYVAGLAVQRMIAKWARPDHLGALARRLRVIVAPGILPHASVPLLPDWNVVEAETPMPELGAALEAAGRDGIPLLLLLGLVEVNCEAVGVLRQSVEHDPMFGFAVPRIGCLERCCFMRLPRHGVNESEWLPRRFLADLPDKQILVEVASPCVLIAPQVAGNFGSLDARFGGLAAALLHYMATARRCGFRTVLSNRAMVGIDGVRCDAIAPQPMLALSAPDDALLRQVVPDFERSWRECRAGSCERFEKLCTSAMSRPNTAPRPSLLLDLRNVGAMYNGTTQAVLGAVKGLKQLQPDWKVAILAQPQGAVFHDLERVYADWLVYTALPDRPFTVTLRLSQPWHIQEMVDLHALSLFNAYLLLDTIAWDIAYAAPPHLEGVWQFLADHADALVFDSDFTRRRFVERFPAGRSVPSVVTHLSFDPGEYVRADVSKAAGDGKFILVIGNELEHKDVRPTVDALASAFPFRRIKALGPASVVSPYVTAQRSGELPELEIHRLYATAEYVVFPSLYEGFGFPIVTALAYGRTVLARRSALLDEVAARCVRRGRLVLFDRREDLVELLGRLVHGEPVPDHPLGLGLTNDRPKSWRDVARDTLAFLESIVREPSRSRWIAREHAVSQLLSYRT